VTIQIDEIDHFMIDDDYNMFIPQATNYSNKQNKPKLLVYFIDMSLLIRYIKLWGLQVWPYLAIPLR
jgi:hypothetical protein